MATLRNMTRVGADVRQIARLLQAKAPENHMLAYITPEEAKFLKDRGGSGMPDAETGIPSFAPAYDYGGYGFTEDTAYDIGDVRSEGGPQVFSNPDYSQAAVSGSTVTPAVDSASAPVTFMDTSPGGYQRFVNEVTPQRPDISYGGDMGQYGGAFPIGTLDRAPGPTGQTYQIDTIPEKNIMQRLSEGTGMSKESLARLVEIEV